MIKYNTFNNGESETGAVGFGGKIGMENFSLVLRRNSATGIFNLHSTIAGISLSDKVGPDYYSSFAAHGFHGVLEKIGKYPADLFPVQGQFDIPVHCGEVEGYAGISRTVLGLSLIHI